MANLSTFQRKGNSVKISETDEYQTAAVLFNFNLDWKMVYIILYRVSYCVICVSRKYGEENKDVEETTIVLCHH